MDNYNYPQGSDDARAPWNDERKECHGCHGSGNSFNPEYIYCRVCSGDGYIGAEQEDDNDRSDDLYEEQREREYYDK